METRSNAAQLHLALGRRSLAELWQLEFLFGRSQRRFTLPAAARKGVRRRDQPLREFFLLGQRFYAGILIGAAASLLSGCQAFNSQEAALSPPAVVASAKPWEQAALVSARIPASSVVIGYGHSMEPLYSEGTVLVLQHLQWEELRAGMTVIYNPDPQNPFHAVAHVLLARRSNRWISQGINEQTPDEVRVTNANYVGTVVAAFRSAAPSSARWELAANLSQ